MEFQNLSFEKKESIAYVKINRPEKLNALNSKTLDELSALFASLKNNDDVLVVILSGEGEKAFVAGADISELNKLDNVSGLAFAEKGQAVFNQIENLGKPVIAAVNGYALGGGCELALACHMRIASSRAKFGQPEVNLGIIPGYGGTQRLARLVNTGRALEYILTGDTFDADEAFRVGLVNRVCAPEELMETASAMAAKIISKGRIAVKSSVKAVVNGSQMSLEKALEYEAALFARCCGSDDFKEGTGAFLEKRKPEFKNK